MEKSAGDCWPQPDCERYLFSGRRNRCSAEGFKSGRCHLRRVSVEADGAENKRRSIPLGVTLRSEIQTHAVNAIAQMSRRRAIVEHMTEMAAAATAVNLGAHHAIAAVT